MSQLKSSSEKLVNSKLSLASLQQAAEGTRMLVPITSSLYVPGETTQLSNVLIDVGTGYYIEKSVDEAQAFLDRKIAMIKAQAGNVQQVASMKQQNLQGTMNVMNQKAWPLQGAAERRPNLRSTTTRWASAVHPGKARCGGRRARRTPSAEPRRVQVVDEAAVDGRRVARRPADVDDAALAVEEPERRLERARRGRSASRAEGDAPALTCRRAARWRAPRRGRGPPRARSDEQPA